MAPRAPHTISTNSDEAAFFGEEFLDPELVALAPPPNPLTPIVLLMLGAFAAFLMSQYAHDAAYVLAKDSVIELGDVMTWTGDNSYSRDGQYLLPENRLARLEGVTQRRAVIGDRGYAKLTGVPIFAEVSVDALDEASQRGRTVGEYLDMGGDRHVVSEPGRLVRFSKLPMRYQAIARYLSRSFEIPLCGVDLDAELLRAFAMERERRIMHLADQIDRDPTPEEISAHIGPPCYDAWLYQEGVRPADHRPYAIGFAVVSLLFLGCIAALVHWVRRFREFHA